MLIMGHDELDSRKRLILKAIIDDYISDNEPVGSRTIAKKHDIELIELDYWCENTDAKEFYKKHQFSNCREFVYKQL